MAAPQLDARQIFLEAVEKHPPDQWPAFLDGACQDKGELRQRVEALLSAHGRYNEVLDGVGLLPTLATAMAERPGSQIGPYKLLQQIGEGGFGVVFMAEQSEPLRRRVAVKVIKPGMDTRQVIARFEAERQALAVMDHPNIARVFDGGATESGRPYFVMELVRGIPITQFCDENNLSVRERLELFATVCQALQHAHTKGIIHRDIKPSNVLVTRQDGVATVKVIDFGIAKAMGQQLTEKTLFTDFAAMIGTPLYMSPEQAELSGADIDTRSDIYSLGVLLYELLTGTTPVSREKLKQAAFDEVRRIIREDEPQRPSTRVETAESAPSIAAQRHTEPAKLARLMRGELDWIVMKSLDKDRNRRYETASAFAADISRHLHNEPVYACPPSRTYRLKKLIGKNRRLFGVAATIALLLVFGAVGAIVAAIQANELAEKERELRSAAEKQAKTEAAARVELDRKLYFNLIALAQQELFAQHIGRAHELLDQAPQDLRGWEWSFLRRFKEGNPLLLSEHYGGVAFGPLRRHLAVRREGPHVDLIDPVNGERARTLSGIATWYESYGLDFHPSIERPIVAAGDYTQKFVKIWNADSGEVLQTLTGHGDRLRCVTFSPDGKQLAVGAIAKGAKVWNWESGELLYELPDSGISRFAYSADGKRLAIAVWGGEHEVIVLDAKSGRELRSFAKHVGGIEGVAYSPKAPLVATCGNDGIVMLWNATTGELVRSLRGHTGPVLDVAFSGDGKRLASGGWDKAVKLWDVETGQEALTLRGHSESILRLEFSADGNLLASAAVKETMIWNATPLDSELDKELETTAIDIPGHTDFVTSVEFSSDGNYLASAGRDGSIKLTRAAKFAEKGSKPECVSLEADAALGMSLTFRPDSKRLAASSWDSGAVRLWNPETAQTLPLAKYSKKSGRYIAFSPDGRRIAAVGAGVISESDATTGETIWRIKLPYGAIYGLVYSPDSKFIAVCHHQRMEIWDVENRKIFKEIGHPNLVWASAFAPDGDRLATACSDHAVRIWSVGDGRELRVMRGHSDKVLSVKFSVDGAWIASGGADGAVKVWDAATGRELATFRGHTGYVWSVAFGPDRQWLASGGGHDRVGEVKVWRIGDTLNSDGDSETSRRRRRQAASFNRILAISQPKVWEHRRNLAAALAQNQQVDEAIVEYVRAFELNPAALTAIVDSLIATCGIEKSEQLIRGMTASYEKASGEVSPTKQQAIWRYFADAFDRIGQWHKSEERAAEAIEAHRQAIAAYEIFLTRYPGSDPYQRLRQSFRCNDLAFAVPANKRSDLGQQLVRRAIELKQGLVDEFPDSAWYKFHLAHSQLGLAYILQGAGRASDAERSFADAHASVAPIAADAAAIGELKEHLGYVLRQLGNDWLRFGRDEQAGEMLRRSLEAFRSLAAKEPEKKLYREEAGKTLVILGRLHRRFQRWINAEAAWREAAQLNPALAETVAKEFDEMQSARKAMH